MADATNMEPYMVPFWLMANLTLKDLPDNVHQALKEAARARGRSLNGYIIDVLTRDVEERARRKRMRETRLALNSFVGSLPHLDDSTVLIREDRDGNR